MHWRVIYASDEIVLDVVFPPTYPAHPPTIRVLRRACP
jgi:ubiquitin-protein ligase